ncbi:hypothetical protein BC826DRAFT_1057299 [Russula brevipes]|nr:hypothetical protein BC826DRAFT_1057299 [Russula brevipes]
MRRRCDGGARDLMPVLTPCGDAQSRTLLANRKEAFLGQNVRSVYIVRVFSFDFSSYSAAPSGSIRPGQRATVTSGDINVVHQLSGCGSQLGSDGDDREFSAPNFAVLASSPLVCLSSRAGQLIGSGHGYCFGKRFAIYSWSCQNMRAENSKRQPEGEWMVASIQPSARLGAARIHYSIPITCGPNQQENQKMHRRLAAIARVDLLC